MNLVHYWINLSRSIKRRVFMENQFNNRNIKNYRVSAITPDDFDMVFLGSSYSVNILENNSCDDIESKIKLVSGKRVYEKINNHTLLKLLSNFYVFL